MSPKGGPPISQPRPPHCAHRHTHTARGWDRPESHSPSWGSGFASHQNIKLKGKRESGVGGHIDGGKEGCRQTRKRKKNTHCKQAQRTAQTCPSETTCHGVALLSAQRSARSAPLGVWAPPNPIQCCLRAPGHGFPPTDGKNSH